MSEEKMSEKKFYKWADFGEEFCKHWGWQASDFDSALKEANTDTRVVFCMLAYIARLLRDRTKPLARMNERHDKREKAKRWQRIEPMLAYLKFLREHMPKQCHYVLHGISNRFWLSGYLGDSYPCLCEYLLNQPIGRWTEKNLLAVPGIGKKSARNFCSHRRGFGKWTLKLWTERDAPHGTD